MGGGGGLSPLQPRWLRPPCASGRNPAVFLNGHSEHRTAWFFDFVIEERNISKLQTSCGSSIYKYTRKVKGKRLRFDFRATKLKEKCASTCACQSTETQTSKSRTLGLTFQSKYSEVETYSFNWSILNLFSISCRRIFHDLLVRNMQIYVAWVRTHQWLRESTIGRQ